MVSVCASPWPYVQCCSGRVCVIIQKIYTSIVPEKKTRKKRERTGTTIFCFYITGGYNIHMSCMYMYIMYMSCMYV